MRVEPDKPIKLPGGTLIGDHDPKAQSDLPFVCEEVERTYQAEIERLEAERDQALQCLVRIHHLGRAQADQTAAQMYDPNHPALRRRCKVCGAQSGETCGTESDGSYFVHIGRRGFWYRLGVASERASEDASSMQGI